MASEPSAPLSPPPYPPTAVPVQGHPDMMKPNEQYPLGQPMPQQITMAMIPVMFGDHPQLAFCSNCNRQVMTQIEKVNGSLVWLSVFILLIFTAGLLCFVPLCIDSLKDTEHFCPNCRNFLGRKCKM